MDVSAQISVQALQLYPPEAILIFQVLCSSENGPQVLVNHWMIFEDQFIKYKYSDVEVEKAIFDEVMQKFPQEMIKHGFRIENKTWGLLFSDKYYKHIEQSVSFINNQN